MQRANKIFEIAFEELTQVDFAQQTQSERLPTFVDTVGKKTRNYKSFKLRT